MRKQLHLKVTLILTPLSRYAANERGKMAGLKVPDFSYRRLEIFSTV